MNAVFTAYSQFIKKLIGNMLRPTKGSASVHSKNVTEKCSDYWALNLQKRESAVSRFICRFSKYCYLYFIYLYYFNYMYNLCCDLVQFVNWDLNNMSIFLLHFYYGQMMTTWLVETCCLLIFNKLRISCEGGIHYIYISSTHNGMHIAKINLDFIQNIRQGWLVRKGFRGAALTQIFQNK
jgi:hypothetical protein